jgi:ankyrin repeat protein
MENVFQIVRLNDIDTYYSIIDNVDVDMLNEDNQNLLHESISYNNNDISFNLIEKNINLNQKDKDGKTPLHYCAAFNNYEVAKMILERDGDINICDNHGNTPLWVAVFNARGTYGVVKLFLTFKANVNNKNKANKSPLDFAKQIEDDELIEILTS